MPQIQDYSAPETQGQGPVGGISPNLEAVSAPGRALQNLGSTAEQASDMFHRRDAAKEVSNAYSQFARLRADWSNQLDQQSSDPNFDSQKFQQQYGDAVNNLSQSYNTAEGKDFFNKQASRLGGALLIKASKIQMQVAGDQAKAQIQGAINNDTTTLLQNPEQFADTVDAGQQYVDAQIEANPKLAPHRELLKQTLAESQAVAALKGYQNQDPGSIADGRDGKGQQMLDDPTSTFSQYLRPATRDKLEAYFKSASRASDAQGAIQDRQQAKMIKDGTEALGNKFLQQMQNNTFSPRDALNAKLPDGTDAPWEFKKQMIATSEEFAKHQFDSNPAVKADTLAKMASGEIIDGSQIMKKMGKGGLSPGDTNELMNMVGKTPEAKEEFKADKQFIASAGAQIRFKTLDTMGNNTYSPTGDTKYAQFITDYNKRKEELRAAGKPLSDLRDPSSPNYFNPQQPQYQTTPQDRYKIPTLAPTAPTAPKPEMVDVIDPNGKVGKIPKANLDRAKLKGYKVK